MYSSLSRNTTSVYPSNCNFSGRDFSQSSFAPSSSQYLNSTNYSMYCGNTPNTSVCYEPRRSRSRTNISAQKRSSSSSMSTPSDRTRPRSLSTGTGSCSIRPLVATSGCATNEDISFRNYLSSMINCPVRPTSDRSRSSSSDKTCDHSLRDSTATTNIPSLGNCSLTANDSPLRQSSCRSNSVGRNVSFCRKNSFSNTNNSILRNSSSRTNDSTMRVNPVVTFESASGTTASCCNQWPANQAWNCCNYWPINPCYQYLQGYIDASDNDCQCNRIRRPDFRRKLCRSRLEERPPPRSCNPAPKDCRKTQIIREHPISTRLEQLAYPRARCIADNCEQYKNVLKEDRLKNMCRTYSKSMCSLYSRLANYQPVRNY